MPELELELEFDLRVWAAINAMLLPPEELARKLALLVTSFDELPERFDVMADELAGAIGRHQSPAAEHLFRKQHDWWKAQLFAGEWLDI